MNLNSRVEETCIRVQYQSEAKSTTTRVSEIKAGDNVMCTTEGNDPSGCDVKVMDVRRLAACYR